MAIYFKDTAELPEPAVEYLYTCNKWTVYTRDMPKLMEAIRNSLAVITAWEGEKLAGLIRAVGDGQTILYIQDILVLEEYRRQGVGTELLQKMLETYPNVRQKVLLTDDSSMTRGFYEANGFASCDKGQLVAFARID